MKHKINISEASLKTPIYTYKYGYYNDSKYEKYVRILWEIYYLIYLCPPTMPIKNLDHCLFKHAIKQKRLCRIVFFINECCVRALLCMFCSEKVHVCSCDNYKQSSKYMYSFCKSVRGCYPVLHVYAIEELKLPFWLNFWTLHARPGRVKYVFSIQNPSRCKLWGIFTEFISTSIQYSPWISNYIHKGMWYNYSSIL